MDENDLKDAIPVEIFLALKNIVRLRSMQAVIEIDELRSRLREFEDGNGCQN